jgi:hypothetical protein
LRARETAVQSASCEFSHLHILSNATNADFISRLAPE